MYKKAQKSARQDRMTDGGTLNIVIFDSSALKKYVNVMRTGTMITIMARALSGVVPPFFEFRM
jgi:hypothetical protein